MRIQFTKPYDLEIGISGEKRHFETGEVLYGIVEWNFSDEDEKDEIDIHLTNDEWFNYVPISSIDELPY